MMDSPTGFVGTTPSGVMPSLRGPGIYVPKTPSIFAKFIEMGYSPIPRYKIDGDSKWPKAWSDFCDRQATEAEMAKWARSYDRVALCCGFGNLLAVDVDTDDPDIKRAVLDALPHCRIGRFGSKGFALLVRYQGERIPSIYPQDEACKQPIVEFKGDGANITVPPSLHAKTGKPYVWLDPETGEAIKALPPIEELPILNSGDVKRVQEALAPYAGVPQKQESTANGASAPVTVAGDKRIAAYFKAGYESETKALANLKEGRPTALFKGVCGLGWGMHHGLIGKTEFAQGFIDACGSNGLLARDGARAIEATIRSGLERASGDALPVLKDEPEPQFAEPGSSLKGKGGEAPNEAEKQTRAEPAYDPDELPECPEFDDMPWEWDGKGKNKELARNEYNLRVALQYLNVSIAYNEFNYKEEIKGLLHHGPWLDDSAIDALWARIWRECGLKYPKGDFEALLLAVIARENKTHPVRKYLKSLEWDGVERVDEWLHAYLGAEDTPENRTIGRKFLIAAVRRARKPGCKFDHLPVLEGAQGIGKSRAGRALCPDERWFSENVSLNQEAKEIIEQTCGKWIAEIGELAGLSKRDAEHVKQMLSRREDEARLSYDRLKETRPRQFVMLATTNLSTYLTDPTGNRRFWPVKCGIIDIKAIERDRDQLWAEAARYEAQGEAIHVQDDAMLARLRAAQEEREECDAWEDVVREYIEGRKKVIKDFDKEKFPLHTIAYAALDIDKARFSMAEQKRLANVLRKLGWEKVKSNGERWWRPVPLSAVSASTGTDSAL